MKIGCNELRVGMLIEHNTRLWNVTKAQHVKPGKGGAFVQVEMKDIQSGTKVNERFRSDEVLERARLDEYEAQFLYKDGSDFVFMNAETFEQVIVPEETVGDNADFLQDNMVVTLSFHGESIVSMLLPETVVMEVVEAEPVVKGQTASSSFKPAVLSNGVRIMVPQHIDSGVKIVVNTAERSYVERAK